MLAAILHRMSLRLVYVCQSEAYSLKHPLSRDKLENPGEKKMKGENIKEKNNILFLFRENA